MSFGTQILDKSDLNSYKEPGNYYCSGSLAAQQLINSPTKNAFVMKVELGTGINYPTQTITSFGDGKKYFRVYIPENTEWRNWVEYVTNTDLTERFKPIRIFGTEGGTFSKTLKNKVYNSVVFLAFDTSVPDNPFSFEAGYAIAFHAGLLKAENVFTLIGFDSNALHPLEIKMLDLRS